MNCFRWKYRRTAPAPGSSKTVLIPSRPPRVNGWTWPPRVYQVVGWLVYIFLATVGFGIHIPLLPLPWKYVAYILLGVSFFIHLLTHIAAVSIDPADASVRAKKNYFKSMPFLDRTKQAHVIQDQHCVLCDVKVGPKAKHCAACNKCVEDFDHHCMWLNTCVGGRNYWFFFSALVSAVVAVFFLIIILFYIFIQLYVNPHGLRTAPQFDGITKNKTWLMFLPLAPTKTSLASLLVLAITTAVVSIICLVLLCHLLGLHLYLFHEGISTYDYVKRQRKKKSRKAGIEAKKTGQAKHHRDPPQKKEESTDREPPLSLSSSSCKIGSEGHFTQQIPRSICIELNTLTDSSNSENNVDNVTENPTENQPRKMSVITTKSWMAGPEDVRQTFDEKSLPVAQDPPASSVMVPDNT